MLGISVKFSWCKILPWVLMVLCHPDVERSVYWASSIVDMYNRRPADAPKDRRIDKFLHPSSVLRPMLNDFIRTKVMHPVLAFEVSLFRFVPLSDRPAEAEHVWLRDVAMQKRGTRRGVKFSGAHRFDMMRSDVAKDRATRGRLTDIFMELHSLKKRSASHWL